MPLLPGTIHEETANLIESLSRRQKDLQEFQITRLRDFKGSLAIQQRYAAELREDLELFGRNVQNLSSLAEDQERERERREVAHRVQQFANSLDQMRKDSRMALLTSKRNIDSMAQSNRDELLKSTVMSTKMSGEKSGDALINASNDVTEALRRTIGLMQGELERSVLSSQMLEQSSANLRYTTAAHDTLSTLLSTSKQLITALEKSDWLDRLLILAAVAFFFLVVLFILKRRVVDKGIRVAFWWTRFIPNLSGDVELQKVKLLETNTAVNVVTAVTLSTASSLLATTAVLQLPTFSEPDCDAASSTLVPPNSDILSPEVRGADSVQEILISTTMPYLFPPSDEICTTRQSDPRLHQEL